MIENVIEWVKGKSVATVTFPSNSRLANRIIKLAEKYPDDIDYITNKDGSICGHIPVKWVKINPPRNVSDEQREAFARRMHGGGLDDMD